MDNTGQGNPAPKGAVPAPCNRMVSGTATPARTGAIPAPCKWMHFCTKTVL